MTAAVGPAHAAPGPLGGRPLDARGRWRPARGARRSSTRACYDRRPPLTLPRTALRARLAARLLPASVGAASAPPPPSFPPMIRRLIARLLPGRPVARSAARLRRRRRIRCAATRSARRAHGDAPAAGRRLQGVRRRRRRARPAARPRAQGLRHRHRRDARAGEAAVPPRVHHRPPLPARARPRRRRDDRGLDVPRGAEGDDATDEHGRLLSDNVYGTQAEDAARRDFTINALYFDPATEEVWDYVGGVADIRARRLKLIGPPVTRFREDPVRMLRAVRLAAKLGVTIEPKTAAPIPKLAPLMARTCRRRGCSTRCRSCCSPATRSRR